MNVPIVDANASSARALSTTRPIKASRFGVALVLLGGLAACGGGGGSAGKTDAATAPATAAAVSATGLVPAAPAVGITLFADAKVLRPLQDGGVWSYRGTAAAGPGVAPVSYLTSTTQSSTGAGAVTETSSNGANGGAATTALSVAAGAVTTSESVDFAGKGVPVSLQLTELRSPVRQGDQVTILDRRFTDTAIDADGDGKPDALDVAVYAKVVGIETVVPPDLPTLQAVRVDTVVLSRVVYSSSGQTSPVVQGLLQTWYAKGIGIVRQSTSTPTASNNGVATTDELITSWDGVTSGFGAMATTPATIPATSGLFPGQRLSAFALPDISAFAFDDHALVVTNTFGMTSGILVSAVDLRGRVTATHLLPYPGSTTTVRALRDGLVLISTSRTPGADYSIVRVDASGAPVGSTDGAPVVLSNAHVSSQVTRLAVAADDATVWFFWTRSFYDPAPGAVPGSELVLRAFSPAGEPLGPERVIDSGNVLYPMIASAGGQALLSWTRASPGPTANPPYDVLYRSASSTTLGATQVLAQGLDAVPSLTPLRLGADSAVVWNAAIGSNANVGTSGGIRFDASLQAERAGTTFLDEQIPAWPPFDAVAAAPLAGASRLLSVATQQGALWPQSLGWMDLSGSTPLAKLPVQTIRFGAVQPTAVVGFGDRALVFGSDSGQQLTTTVVWLNAGSASP